MKSGIYKITCNNKVYIGSSVNIEKRIKQHKNFLNKSIHINHHLQNAWNKYGMKNFSFEVIEFCEVSVLLEREQYWMDLFKSYERDKSFNQTIKAERPLGFRHSEKDKIKMSKIKKEQIKNGLKSNLSKRLPGFKHSERTKEKIRQTKIGKLNPVFGKKLTKEERQIKGKILNSVPRWNKGLKKEQDPRLNKLAVWKGKLPPNAIKHTLIDLDTGEKWEEKSLKHLSEICPLSASTLARLKTGNVGEKIKNKYKLVW